MINTFLKNVLLRKKRELVKRNFSPQLFISDEIHQLFIKNGYVHLKNFVSVEDINKLSEFFNEVKAKKAFENTDIYSNTISFQDTTIRKFVVENSLKIIQPSLTKFINMDNAKFPLGGNFCISPPNATKGCGLHQDPNLVDETETYSMTIWIPLINTNTKNGCLHFVAGSHLWGNYHRSMSIKSAFEDNMMILRNYANPIPTNIGDIICFDTSVLHGSNINSTENLRLAVNIPVLTKESQMKSYFPVNSLLQNKAEQYNIDENYFIKESQYEKPSSKYKLNKIINLDNFYTKENIDELLKETLTIISDDTFKTNLKSENDK